VIAETLATQSRTGKANARWWLEDKGDVHKAVWRVLQNIENRQQDRKKEFLLYASLYGNLPRLGFGLNSYSRTASVTRISLNVCQNVVDALTAKITKERPRPTFLTEEGDFYQRLRAENLDKFVEGKLYEVDYYEKCGTPAVTNCGIYGTGSVIVPTVDPIDDEDDDTDVKVEHAYPWEWRVDDRSALYGAPRELYRRKYYDKTVLAELYPEHEDSIEKATIEKDPEDFDYDDSCDQILVVEAWHLPPGKDAKGMHAICINNDDLLVEPYEDDDFPVEFIRPLRPHMGFWGIGVCEKLAGLQLEINKLLLTIQRAMHLIARPHWMVPNDAKILPGHLNNDIATIIKYAGVTPPSVYTPQAMTPQAFDHLQWLYAKAFEIGRVSQLSAHGEKPAGLNSGEAQRVYHNIESEGFVNFGRAYETMTMGVAKKMVARARKIAEKRKNYAVKAASSSAFQRISWKDVDMSEDAYVMKVFPTSTLPKEPAGRIQFVTEMMQANLIDPDDGMDLLEFPDTEALAKRRGAARRVIERNIAEMIKHGKAVTPEPMDNHQLALKMVNEAYHEARIDGVPEERLELMRRYMTETEEFMPKPTAPPAGPVAPPPPGGPMPPGMGEPVPIVAAPIAPDVNGAPMPPMPPMAA
jgi:hypothetical protein